MGARRQRERDRLGDRAGAARAVHIDRGRLLAVARVGAVLDGERGRLRVRRDRGVQLAVGDRVATDRRRLLVQREVRDGWREQARDAAVEPALGEPHVAVGAARDAGGVGVGEEAEARRAAGELGERVAGVLHAPDPPGAGAPREPQVAVAALGQRDGVRVVGEAGAELLDRAVGLDAADRGGVVGDREVELAVGGGDDLVRGAGQAVGEVADVAVGRVDAADAVEDRRARPRHAAVVLDRVVDPAVGPDRDVLEVLVSRQVGVELGDGAVGRHPAELAPVGLAEPQVAVGVDVEAREAGTARGRVRDDVAGRGSTRPIDSVMPFCVNHTPPSVASPTMSPGTFRRPVEYSVIVAGRRDAADAGQQALLGEPEVAVGAGRDVGGCVGDGQAGRELRHRGGPSGRGQREERRDGSECGERTAADPARHRIVVGRLGKALTILAARMTAASV